LYYFTCPRAPLLVLEAKGRYVGSSPRYNDGGEGDPNKSMKLNKSTILNTSIKQINEINMTMKQINETIKSMKVFHEDRRLIYTFPSGTLALVRASEDCWKV